MCRVNTCLQLLVLLLVVLFFSDIWILRDIQHKAYTYQETSSHADGDVAELPIKNVFIVYNAFINLKRSNWVDLIQKQVSNLVSNGLIEKTNEFHVHLSIDAITVDDEVAESSINMISSVIYSIVPKAKTIITVTRSNQYEYPGLHKVWEIGQKIENDLEASNSVILYFHSKGMFNGHLLRNPRSKRELQLFQTVIDPWIHVLRRFSTDPTINKAGFAATAYGYMWFNFWWARVSYIKKLVEPEFTEDRYYYERWLGRLEAHHIWPMTSTHMLPLQLARNDSRGAFQSSGDCLSLCRSDVPVGVYFPMRHPCEHVDLTLQQQVSKIYHYILGKKIQFNSFNQFSKKW